MRTCTHCNQTLTSLAAIQDQLRETRAQINVIDLQVGTATTSATVKGALARLAAELECPTCGARPGDEEGLR